MLTQCPVIPMRPRSSSLGNRSRAGRGRLQATASFRLGFIPPPALPASNALNHSSKKRVEQRDNSRSNILSKVLILPPPTSPSKASVEVESAGSSFSSSESDDALFRLVPEEKDVPERGRRARTIQERLEEGRERRERELRDSGRRRKEEGELGRNLPSRPRVAKGGLSFPFLWSMESYRV